MTTSQRACDQFALRIPSGLRALIKASADANRRSMNSEIVVILEKTLLGTSVKIPCRYNPTVRYNMEVLTQVFDYRI